MTKHAPAEIPQARAAGIEAGSPGPGSQQTGRTAYAHLSPNTDTDTPLMNSFSGIARSRVSHLTKIVVARHRILVENCDLATGRIKLATSRRCIGWPMRLRMVACSAPNSSQVPDV